MKNFMLSLSLTLLTAFSQAQNGLDSIIVERYYISNANDTIANSTDGVLPVGSVTYRIYVDMLPGYRFQALYGVPNHELKLTSNTAFFNNEDRGATAPTYTKNNAKGNTVMLDSWFSVGAACASNFGVPKAEDNGIDNVVNSAGILKNTDPLAGIPLTTQDGLLAGTPEVVTFVGLTTELDVFDATSQYGNSFSTSNGSIASLNGSVGPTTDNKVLVAQITTDGEFCYELNIQIGTPSGGVENYVAKNPMGSEIQLPSLIGCIGEINADPSISITSPANAAIFTAPAIVSIEATAIDTDGTVDSVEFFVNSVKVGVDFIAPYETNWTSVAGTAHLTAVATDNLGAKDTSATISITVTPTVSVDDLNSSGSTIRMYPNPAKNTLNMEIVISKKSSTNSYTIYDAKGSAIFYKDLGVISEKYLENIDISSFKTGQYTIELSIDGIISTKQIIKN